MDETLVNLEEPLSKDDFLREFKESIAEMNLAKQEKIKLKTADELLDEL